MTDENGYSCETCKDTGIVTIGGLVYRGEPHTAEVDTQPCPDCCEGATDDEYYDPDNN